MVKLLLFKESEGQLGKPREKWGRGVYQVAEEPGFLFTNGGGG